MTEVSKIAAVVLAAGASTRMGEPKQLLPWKSTTLLNHCINQVIASSVLQTVVVLGANYEKIIPSLNQANIQCIINESWKHGMGSSIAVAVQHILDEDIDGILIILADQPFVNTKYIEALISKFTLDKKLIIASNYNDSFGVPAIFDRHYFEALRSLKEKQGAKQLIHQYTQNVLKITPDFNHLDIDTPEVYQRLYKL